MFPTICDGVAAINAGILDADMRRKPSTARPKNLLDGGLTDRGTPLASLKLDGHPIYRFHPRGVFAARGALLVGDAAGAEPLLGEGIPCAFGYGEVAAAALIEGFGAGDLSFASYRRREGKVAF